VGQPEIVGFWFAEFFQDVADELPEPNQLVGANHAGPRTLRVLQRFFDGLASFVDRFADLRRPGPDALAAAFAEFPRCSLPHGD
jgi:hypothetical protein